MCHLGLHWGKSAIWMKVSTRGGLPAPVPGGSALSRPSTLACGTASWFKLVVPLWGHRRMNDKHKFDTNKAYFQPGSWGHQVLKGVGWLCTFGVYLSGSLQMHAFQGSLSLQISQASLVFAEPEPWEGGPWQEGTPAHPGLTLRTHATQSRQTLALVGDISEFLNPATLVHPDQMFTGQSGASWRLVENLYIVSPPNCSNGSKKLQELTQSEARRLQPRLCHFHHVVWSGHEHAPQATLIPSAGPRIRRVSLYHTRPRAWAPLSAWCDPQGCRPRWETTGPLPAALSPLSPLRITERFSFKHFLSNTGFPGGSDGEESACSAGDLGLIPGLGRSPGEGKGYPLQYPCQENPQGQRSLAGYIPSTVLQSQTWCAKHRASNTLHRRLQGSRYGASCRWKKWELVTGTQIWTTGSQWRTDIVVTCLIVVTLKRCLRIRGHLTPPPDEVDTAAQQHILCD